MTYRYPSQGSASGAALRDLSLQIGEGEHVAIVGANGSGKSTLARHLNALILPDEGQVLVAGLNTRQASYHPEIRRIVGMVFQRPEDQIVATLVEHDVAFGPENLGLPPDVIRERVQESLEAVDLWRDRARPPHMLSAGQMQRLALAGVLAVRPRCVIFDEATAMLDPEGRRAVRALIRDLNHGGITVITITHLMEEALDAERVIVLHKGTVALDGEPAAVFLRTDDLKAFGLGVPTAVSLAESLRSSLPSLPSGLLALPDLITALDSLPHCRADSPDLPDSRPDPASPPIIEASGLGHTYMRDTPFAKRALRGVDLAISEDEGHGLIGATGSGKSTLLQHLNSLLRPQEGQLRVRHYDLTDRKTDVRAIRRMVGLVFQMPETQIFEQYVGDEIAYGPRLAGLQGQELRDRVRWAMDLVGLDFDGFKDRLTFAISGGEKRKVALASSLALHPDILLLDEPTAGLDPVSRQELLGHLASLRESGTTLVLSSHQMEDIAALSQCITVMSEGTTVLHGTTSQVFSQGDRLRAWGLDQPAAALVAETLIGRGWALPRGIFDEGHLVEALLICLGDAA